MRPLLSSDAARLTLGLLLAWPAPGTAHGASAAGAILRVNVNAPPGGDGASWATAFNTLDAALERADERKTVTQIWVAKGTYRPVSRPVGTTPVPPDPREATFALVAGAHLYGGFAGDESSLAERDPAVNVTTLSGDLLGDDVDLPSVSVTPQSSTPIMLDNVRHVVFAGLGADGARLDGFVISGGSAKSSQLSPIGIIVVPDPGLPPVGGGVLARSCKGLHVHGCRFVGNGAERGGAIAAIDSATITVTDCVFDGNTASASGGAILVDSAEMAMAGSAFKNNQSPGLSIAPGGAASIDASNPDGILNLGRLSIGGPAALGEMVVSGNYLQQLAFGDGRRPPGLGPVSFPPLPGSLELDVSEGLHEPAFDKVEVGGTAVLGGSLLVRFAPGAIATSGATWPVLSANGLSGGFGATLATNVPPGFFVTPQYRDFAFPLGMSLVLAPLGATFEFGPPMAFVLGPGEPTDAAAAQLDVPALGSLAADEAARGATSDSRAGSAASLDLLVTVPYPNFPTGGLGTLYTALNIADGLASVSGIATGTNPQGVVAGKFNAGPFTDVAITNAADYNIFVYFNDGVGGLVFNNYYPSGILPAGIATADFDEDGLLDLATADMGPGGEIIGGGGDLALVEAGTYTVYINGFGQAGIFVAGPPLPLTVNPRTVCPTDIDNNECVDLVFTLGGSNAVAVLLGLGNGVFKGRFEAPVGLGPVDLTLGDLNLDGSVDVVTANQGDGTISVLLNNGDPSSGFFAPAINLPLGDAVVSIASADFDLDGDLDLAVVADAFGAGNGNVVQVLRNEFVGGGQLAFTLLDPLPVDGTPMIVVAADANVDGVPDLIVVGTVRSPIAADGGAADLESSVLATVFQCAVVGGAGSR